MIFKKKIDMEAIVPTSKMSLKMSCIRACGKDIKAAEQLYDFFVKDMPSLPDFDAVPPSPMKQITDGAMKVFGWIDKNQDKLAGYYNLFQQMRTGNPVTPPVQDVSGVPPPPAE